MAIRLTALTPAQVTEVIDLALCKEAAEDRGQKISQGDPRSNGAADPDLRKLVRVIDLLSPTAKDELMSLMWLGMGTIDDDENSWTRLLHAVQEDPFEDVPGQLALMPRLPEFLHLGLDKVR